MDRLEERGLCPQCGASWASSPRVGLEFRGVYDGVLVWECPACLAMWSRFGGQLLHPGGKEISDVELQRVVEEALADFHKPYPEEGTDG